MAQQYGVDIVAKVAGDNNIRKLNRELTTTTTVSKKAVGQLTTTSKAYTKTGTAAKAASGGVKLFGKAINAALGPVGAALAAVGGLSAAFQAISGQDFAVAKVKSLGVEAGALNEELKKVSAELNNSVSVAELTGSAYDVASAGFTDAADAAQVLKAASMGATGGFTDMNTAGDALTSVLNAYNLSADQATATMDKFIQTQNDGKIVVDEYARNIGKVASAAASLGVPLDEVNAIIAQSTAAGVNAEVAFTGLKSAIARLASGEANKALEEYGVNINSATIESEGLTGALRQILDSGADTGTVLKALGNEAGPALLPVLNNLDKFNELLENQKDSAGAAAKANKLATDTIQGAWKQLTNVFSNFFTEQTAAGELLKLTLQGLTVVIQGILNAVNLALTPFKVLVGIISGLKQITDTLGASFAAAFDSPEGRALLEVVGLIQQKIGELTQWIAGGFTAAWNGVLWVVQQIGTFIGTTLVTAIDGVVKGLSVTLGWLPKIGGQIKKAEKAWNALKESVDSTTQPLEDAATAAGQIDEKTQSAKLSADQLAEAQKGVTTAIQEATTELDKQAQAQQSIAELQTSLAQERLKTEIQVNNVLLEQAKSQLDSAKNAQERISAAKDIYDLTIKQAKLDLESAKVAIDAALNKVKAQRDLLVLKQQEIQLAVQLAQVEGVVTRQHQQALEAAKQAVVVANKTLKIQSQIAGEQRKQAQAAYAGKVATAQAAFEQNKVWKASKGAADEAGRFAANMSKGAAAASKAASAAGQAGKGGGGSAGGSSTTINLPREIMDQMLSASHQGFKNIFELEEYFKRQTDAINAGNKALKDQAKYDSYKTKAAEYAAVGAEHAAQIYNDAARIMESTIPSLQRAARKINNADRYSNQGGAALPQYGTGGYVSEKQTAVIGESGPEYVIPANRMDQAMANYSSGKRGNAVLNQQVNVTTGPVQQMDGTNYVTLQQATSMSQSAARQGAQMALTQIKTDPGTRRSIGVA